MSSACYALGEFSDGYRYSYGLPTGRGQLNLSGEVELTPLLLEALLPQGTQGRRLDGGESKARGRPGSSAPPRAPHCAAGTAVDEPALTALRLSHCSGPPAGAQAAPAARANWAVLSQLRSLGMAAVDCNDGTRGGATLATLLEQAPEVVAVQLTSCSLTQVPAALEARRGLTALALSFNRLSDLPHGDWLAGE